VHARLVERALPLGHYHGCETISDQVGQGAGLGRSTPRISAMLATGMVPTEASVAASTMAKMPEE
jgi:hypothetical protein